MSFEDEVSLVSSRQHCIARFIIIVIIITVISCHIQPRVSIPLPHSLPRSPVSRRKSRRLFLFCLFGLYALVRGRFWQIGTSALAAAQSSGGSFLPLAAGTSREVRSR